MEMINIYTLRNDVSKYKQFSLRITEIMDIAPENVDKRQVMNFSYFNVKMKDWWKDVKASFHQIEGDPEGEIPDIYPWRAAATALSPKAYKVLKDYLQKYGELLPVDVDGDTYYVFNCLHEGRVDEINSEKDIQNGGYFGVKKITFNSVDVADKLVFKTKFDRCATLYCGDEFKDIVESNALTGVVFKQDLINIF